jgi:hypothetical protein
MRLSSSGGRIKSEEVSFHVLIHLHYSCFVSASVAVVRSREDCYDMLIVGPIITSHDQLVSSSDEFEVIRSVELLGHILSKSIASSSRRDSPSCLLIGIRPKKVAHGSFMRHFLDPIKVPNLIKRLERGRETSMKAENLILNYRSERQ